MILFIIAATVEVAAIFFAIRQEKHFAEFTPDGRMFVC
jgi:hypothetical protein